MTITLDPHQEHAILQAINSGQVASVHEFIEKAIERIAQHEAGAATSRTVFEQGLGLFGSAEDAAMLDEAVALAYEERRHTGNQNPLL